MKRAPAVAVLVFALAWLLTLAAPTPARAQGEPAADAPAAAPSEPVRRTLKVEGEIESTAGERVRSMCGLLLLLGACYAFSTHRQSVSWRIVGWGIGLQVILGILVLVPVPGLGKPLLRPAFELANTWFLKLMGYTSDGASFLFGNLAKVNNVPVGAAPAGEYPPFALELNATENLAEVGSFFAFGVLPTIIFFSSLMAVLYHVGLMQQVVKGLAWVMQRTMGTSGSETLSASGNIFVGQTEAPLLVRPFVKGMTESELMAVMTGGFATVAGGVMAAYVGMLQAHFSDIAGHLLSASVMSAPAALVCAKLLVPEPDPRKSETYGELKIELEKIDVNVIDAAARGAGDGLKLALNVGAMLLAFIALIAMCNGILGWGAELVGVEGLTLQKLLGWLLAPVAYMMGVPWGDALAVGQLIGVKTVANEFVAYLDLKDMLAGGVLQSPRSVVIATYALCGFANFGSIAIQIGGIGGIAPERKQDLARLGLRAMIGGTVAALLTATVAGLLV